MKCSKLMRWSLLAQNGSQPLLIRRSSFHVAARSWQSRGCDQCRKWGRNDGLLLSPQSLKMMHGIGPFKARYIAMIRVLFWASVESLVTASPDVLFILHAKNCAFTAGRIRSYPLLHRTEDDVYNALLMLWIAITLESNWGWLMDVLAEDSFDC